jgi:hypothetical protein
MIYKKWGRGKAKFNYDKSAANVDGKMKKLILVKNKKPKKHQELMVWEASQVE